MSPVKFPVDIGAPGVGKQDKIVVEKDEAEELPPGWTKEVRLRKTGSATKKDRFYTDPVTGYIFHSLKDVQRYLKTGEVGRLATKPKTEEREETSKLKEQMSETLRHKRAATDKSELPARASKRLAGVNSDALLPSPPLSPSPPKTRQATRLAGIDVDAPLPSRSLSEPQTRQPTRLARVAVDAPHSPLDPKTRQATRLAEVAVDASLPSPSPPEPKTRQATRFAGVVVDALPSPPEPKTCQATRLAGVAVDASPSPPEPKTCQATRLAEVAVDASLQSPSQPEPKTRQGTRLAGVAVGASPEPKTRQATRPAEVAVDVSLPSQPEPKTRQGTRLEEVAVDATPPSPPDTRSNRKATKQTGPKIDESVPSPPPPVPKTRQAARQAGIKIDSPPQLPPDSKTHQATPLKGTEIGPSPPSQPEPKTRQAKRAAGIRDNASPSRPKTRRATQEAGIKINPPPPLPDTRTGRQATRTRQVKLSTPKENDKNTQTEKITDKHNVYADMDANTNHNQENYFITPPSNQESNEKQELRNILPPVTSKEHNKQIDLGPTTSQLPEAQPPPTVVPPVNLGKQESPVVNPTISNLVPQDSYSYGSDTKPDSSINFSMNDLWTDPCIEFAVKTLTGAIPFTDLNKVENFTAPAKVPLEELWTDPCIEFAVKTLTGVIPVGEDDYLLHRPSSSTNPQGPSNFSSPMSAYQTGHKNKQQDSVFPTLGNGGLQKSGKFVNGANGQCSRSRFFQ